MMRIEQIEYKGWTSCIRMENGLVELVATLDVGPRILSFGFAGGQNLLKQFDGDLGRTGGTTWRSYGGHRLWHAPEVEPRTYYPDNEPVQYRWEDDRLTLVPPEQKENGLQLSLEIRMHESEPEVRVRHAIRNTGRWRIELAPWALTVMAAGGEAYLPREPFVEHGESYSPARPLVLWRFTEMDDPRFTWGKRFVRVREDASIPAKQKIGALNTLGWLAYELNGEVFLKRFPFFAGEPYPDMGSNCELYTEPGFLELESLGPLTVLAPGETALHTEAWRLARLDLPAEEDLLESQLPQPVTNGTRAPAPGAAARPFL